jgi:type VI secretion system protein ImpF
MKRASSDGFTSSVWDRLIATPHACAAHEGAVHLTLEQFKRVIARDLEALLNTRVALSGEALAGLPSCRNSIVNFGLADFAQLCLSDSEDRKEICDRLRAAIERHERRLSNVRVQLVSETGMVNRLSFLITGQLRAIAANERTQFDVRLEPSSLHYSIS